MHSDDDQLDRIVSRHATPDVSAIHSELRDAIIRLEPKYRAIINMYYFEGLGYAEIALVLAKPQGSIQAWTSRAKDQLRKELE